MLDIASAYMLRNDGKLIHCEVMHPYIKYIVQNSNKIEIEDLFNKRIDHLIWFYNNCKSAETKKYISIFTYSVLAQPYYNINNCDIENKIPNTNLEELTKNKIDIESLFLTLNDQLNQEFLRIRTSSKLFGGTSHAIYFRISSTDFNWFNLIWKLVYENKDWISDVTISLDPQSRESKAILNHNGLQINKIPVLDFINLNGNPVFEDLNINHIKKELSAGDKSLFEIFETHPANIHNYFNLLVEEYKKKNFMVENFQINNYLKNFINDNMDSINKNDFTYVYHLFDQADAYDQLQTSKFTQVMLGAKINPLDFMEGVPPSFLFECEDVENVLQHKVMIPKHLMSIGAQAFSGTTWNNPILISNNMLKIEEYAFSASYIYQLIINANDSLYIDPYAFSDALIRKLEFRGKPANLYFCAHVDGIAELTLPITKQEFFLGLAKDYRDMYQGRSNKQLTQKVTKIICSDGELENF